MAKSLNFNNVKKQYLTVTLADENNTTLMIGTPKKGVMTELLLLSDSLESIQEGDDNSETMDNLYSACAKIMSCNKGGVQVTKEMLEDNFDLEDILIFFNAYMGFVDEIAKSKNSNSPTIR